jgi:hypothetical protein
MPPVRLIVASPEGASEVSAELWVGGDLLAVTVPYDGRVHLRILPRPDGEPWLIDPTSLTLALESAARQLGDY